MSKTCDIDIVLPAKNEAQSLRALLPELKKFDFVSRIIVVNDGSTDETAEICEQYDVEVVSHHQSLGNGAAIKTGARHASATRVLFMDADTQHDPQEIARLLDKSNHGYDLVIGARQADGHASLFRRFANSFYNKVASFMTGQTILDLTSGFRLVDREKFLGILHLLPNKFSYPTTSTMAFLRLGYQVTFEPINARKRVGKSHIRIFRDGARFLIIIFRIGTLYSPLRVFLPISACFFMSGFIYSVYSLTMLNRFTNMSALLLSVSVVVFLIGLVSEQITVLQYKSQS